MKKFEGICAALLTPYDESGKVNCAMLKKQVRWLIGQGIDGFYVCGSTGEAFLLSPQERMAILDAVCEENNGEKLVIAHIGQIATEHALELGRHAKAAGADAISSISPFYYKFSSAEIQQYYLDLMNALEMPFFIYNFPAFSGFSLTPELLDEMCACPYVAGVKFTSSDFFQLERMKRAHPDLTIWNGYDEMLLSGLSAGADGGIGGTYGVMPELFLKADALLREQKMDEALAVQYAIDEIIYAMCECRGNLYAVMKEILRLREGIDIGGVRKPMPNLFPEDMPKVQKCAGMISAAIEKYC